MKDWTRKRVLILGAARQGLALARYLSGQGATVTLNDQRPETLLLTAIDSLKSLPIRWVLGEHPTSLLKDTDLVCISGGVPLDNPIVVEAVSRQIPLSNDSQIFMEAVPCPVIGITGSAGKTTTTTLVGRMADAAAAAPQKVWVGGNIGLPLIDLLPQIKSDDLVVLELSSFQLEQMTISPWVGAILNITPNHLDRHGNMATYIAAKARLIEFQTEADVAVLSRDDPNSWALSPNVHGRLVSFGLKRPDSGMVGTYFSKEALFLAEPQQEMLIMPVSMIRLRGVHNLFNVLAACAVAHAAGIPVASMMAGVAGFNGVAHRLEFVRSWGSADWYNDSIATAPERTMAAIRSFDEPLVLLLGGRDKNLPWEDLAKLIHQRVDHVILFGEAASKIQQAIGTLQADRRPYTLKRCTGMKEAILEAASVVNPGDVVLLSPGGTSFDEFRDFEERGERFIEWVNQLS